MKKLIVLLLLLSLPCAVFAQGKQPRKVFPYAYTIDDMPNGLRLITVPTDYPNLVSLYIVVQTGSRNEIEAGKSGYAHFFEHLMFRGSENYTSEQRDAARRFYERLGFVASHVGMKYYLGGER